MTQILHVELRDAALHARLERVDASDSAAVLSREVVAVVEFPSMPKISSRRPMSFDRDSGLRAKPAHWRHDMTAATLDSHPLATTVTGSRPSSRALWAGRIVTGFAVLFLTFDTALKLVLSAPAVEATAQLGFAPSLLLPIGIIELVCLIVYLVPRTAPLGALLWTGYLGGAIATHLRLGNPMFSHTLFPIYIAAMVWIGLWLRDDRVRTLVRSIVAPRSR